MLGVAVAASMGGFLAGLFSFKIKSRWCPTCGSTTHAHLPSEAHHG